MKHDPNTPWVPNPESSRRLVSDAAFALEDEHRHLLSDKERLERYAASLETQLADEKLKSARYLSEWRNAVADQQHERLEDFLSELRERMEDSVKEAYESALQTSEPSTVSREDKIDILLIFIALASVVGAVLAGRRR